MESIKNKTQERKALQPKEELPEMQKKKSNPKIQKINKIMNKIIKKLPEEFHKILC